ncbi:MAG: tyrosine-type recombinase/integrase [Verrucomicrobiaceae bacterium]|nr:tyrosine-type recombinase/integrase [Verrucomicrobiaceae bacterium]
MKSPDNASLRQGAMIKRRQRTTTLKLLREVLPSGRVRWLLSGLYVAGKRKREYFTTEDAGKRRLQTLEMARVNTGTLAERIARKPEHAADAGRAADLLAPYELTLQEVAREYVECRKALDGTGLGLLEAVKDTAARHQARRASLTLRALGERFLSDPETLKLSTAYRADVRNRWRRFEDDFGPETLAFDVTPDKLRRWLAGMDVSAMTKGNFHRTISAVFSYAIHAELVTDNPFRKVKKPTVETKDGVDVFTPEQMAALLRVAHKSWLPVLVIGGFAGLRPEELRRLDWEEIDLDGGFIEVKATKSKTGKRRLVTISKNLKAWLAPYAGQTGRVAQPNERRHRRAAMKAVKLDRWPMDVLRHSFASYHVALHKDLNETALQLGHTSTKMLFQHYREAVKPEAARQWWALKPGSGPTAKVINFKTNRKQEGAA